MQLKVALALVLCVGLSLAENAEFPQSAVCAPSGDIYDITIEGMQNEDIDLNEYRDKVFMIFNSAVYSDKVYTDQYLVYNELIEEYGKDNFDVIAIPTNQFGMEDPGLDREILNEITYVRPGNGFVPNYVVASSGKANGASADEIFEALKEVCPSPLREKLFETSKIYWSPTKQDDITWNFEKFLVDSQGMPMKRYIPVMSPNSTEIRGDIETLIAQKKERLSMSKDVVRQMHLPRA